MTLRSDWFCLSRGSSVNISFQQRAFLYSIRSWRKRPRQKWVLRNTAAKRRTVPTKLITAFRIELYKGLIGLLLFNHSPCFAVDSFLLLPVLSFSLPAFAVNPNPIWRGTCHARETNLSAPVKLFHHSRTKTVHLLQG